MVDRQTARVYELQASEWTRSRTAVHLDAVNWINKEREPGPIVDIGTGPGWHLAPCDPPAVGLDAAAAMLALARGQTNHPLIQGSAAELPFRSQSLGGAIASRVYNHVPANENPVALADLHRCLRPEAPVLFQLMTLGDPPSGSSDWGSDTRSRPPFTGRLTSRWTDTGLADLLEGAGFDDVGHEDDADGCRTIRARRRFSLPDTVGPAMRLLICGLNPSPAASETGVGFGRPGNRFWPAALAVGLVSVDRDPAHALRHHRVGMTDLVKRTTRKARELDPDEYRVGVRRVERLIRWLQPAAVCFVGLAGWRIAVDRRATPGLQNTKLGGRPTYLMPSTSGLNASSQLPDFIEHLQQVLAVADSADRA